MLPETITSKIERPTKPQLIRSILAGIYISLGATLMLACKADGMPSIVCGIAFSLGLWLVMCADGELFTGNCLLLAEYKPWEPHQCMRPAGIGIDNRNIARCLFTTYIGNLIGSLMMAALLHLSGSYLGIAAEIAAAKCAVPVHVTLIKSLLCNLCVCLAVSIGCTQKSPLEKLICAALPVACFVACGWEHSIADMFFLPLGAASLPDMLRVIGVATIGNMLSGFAIAKARQHI